MQLVSRVPPPYLPDNEQETVLQLGLSPLSIAHWIQPDIDFAAFHAHKLQSQLEFPDQVYAALPESVAAQQSFADMLVTHLLAHHADIYTICNNELTHIPTALSWSLRERSLAAVSRWLQEDICILEPDTNGYKLTAASVCSPSNWHLETKIGCSVDEIHAPVPGYQKVLSSRVNRLLAKLKPEKPVYRFNWSIQRGNELLWRDDIAHEPNADTLYWRTERQSLLRVPGSSFVVFSIRIYLHSFVELVAIPSFKRNLGSILKRLPAEQCCYKGLLDKIF